MLLSRPFAPLLARAGQARPSCRGDAAAVCRSCCRPAAPSPRPGRVVQGGYAAPAPRRSPPRPRATLLPDPIPSDLDVTVTDDESLAAIEYDEEAKTIRIPLKELGQGARRTKLVMFTCNACGGRSSRMVNPLAWEKGVVFGQCQHCEVWHTLSSNNKKILEEIRYSDYELGGGQGAAGGAAEAAGSSEGGGGAAGRQQG